MPPYPPHPRRRASPDDYVELRARSAFSFLEGSAQPEDLAERAAELGYPALALADRHGVSGAPRFHKACQAAGMRGLVGAELSVARPGGFGSLQGPGSDDLLLLVESPEGWRRLCRLITAGQADRPKGECRVEWDDVAEHARDWTVLVRGDARLRPELLDRLRGVFGDDRERLWVDVSRHLDRSAERQARRAADMAEAHGVPVVATGDVRCAHAHGRPLLDALTCLRHKTSLEAAGRLLLPNGERHLQSRAAMVERFADRPEWIRATRSIADRCAFTLENLGYRFPEFPLAPGETQQGRLEALAWQGARERYGAPLAAKVRRQIEHELRVIGRLDLAGYFLIVHDIATFAKQSKILCQGRGSAANSAVCYSLGITAVDPIGMELLFERFLSDERGEWPDIDLDLPSGDQRERVIQYVFKKYATGGSAMTANVITYRLKMALREMGKVVGLDGDTLDRLSKTVGRLEAEDTVGQIRDRMRGVGLDDEAPRVKRLLELIMQVQGLPRHLGQHSGGVVIAAGRLDEVVPIEPASMEDRRIVQWDKDDCADLGIIKIDLLGLGMLQALEETIPLVHRHEGVDLDLAKLPPDDPATYDMICDADTVGVFQIESRAQMATLPRMKPRHFYDLVVEIAIIRPGPIVGQMVHPYLNRRAGREPVEVPHESLRPILERTLGVPIFQEQLLRVAMTAAGFTGGEAEELRRAMGFKRSLERMEKIEARLREGMRRNGFSPAAQDEIVRHITSFALYGFPESHSASFALIAYASAYLKRHHPAAFLVGLLNAWPMGFYNPATLVKDAQRHGVEVRPIDVTRSCWTSSLEPRPPGHRAEAPPGAALSPHAIGLAPAGRAARPAVRVGLRFVKGLREDTALRLAHERRERAFDDLSDLVKRVGFVGDELDALAEAGALAGLEGAAGERRAAQWQVAGIERDPRSLFAGHTAADHDRAEAAGLWPMTEVENTLADYRRAGLTTGPQLLAHFRRELRGRGILAAADLRAVPNGRFVRTAGHVIVRQRPGSAKGFVFLTLEDETGLCNAVVTPPVFERFRAPMHAHALLEVAGPIQNVDGVIHVRLTELAPLELHAPLPPSRSYR